MSPVVVVEMNGSTKSGEAPSAITMSPTSARLPAVPESVTQPITVRVLNGSGPGQAETAPTAAAPSAPTLPTGVTVTATETSSAPTGVASRTPSSTSER